MNSKFEKIYNELLVEYSIPKQFDIKVTDFTPETIQDEQKMQQYFKANKIKFKKLNGVTRVGKCMRDMKDHLIQMRDNDVQLTAVEVEE